MARFSGPYPLRFRWGWFCIGICRGCVVTHDTNDGSNNRIRRKTSHQLTSCTNTGANCRLRVERRGFFTFASREFFVYQLLLTKPIGITHCRRIRRFVGCCHFGSFTSARGACCVPGICTCIRARLKMAVDRLAKAILAITGGRTKAKSGPTSTQMCSGAHLDISGEWDCRRNPNKHEGSIVLIGNSLRDLNRGPERAD